jgi:RNA polymerase sigma-70 factor (ECF subfamily)
VQDPPAERVAALFDAHHERLYRLARRLVPSQDDAFDLVQDTFLKVAAAPMRVPYGFTDEEAWLVRVLINIRRDQWRKEATRRTNHAATQRADTCVDEEAAHMARADVWSALDLLSPRRRVIVILHELEERDVKSIATLLGISAITVRWHLSRGRRELAQVLKARIGERHDNA